MADQQSPDKDRTSSELEEAASPFGQYTSADESTLPDSGTLPVHPRLWPAAVVLVVMWLVMLTASVVVPGSTSHFISMALAPLVAAVMLFLWWLFASRVPWWDRLLGIALFVLAVVAAGMLIHPSMQPGMLFYVLPTALTVSVVVLAVSGSRPWQQRRAVVVLSILVTFGLWCLIRSNGMDGSMNTDFAWRWSATSEQLFLDSPFAQQPADVMLGEPGKLPIPTAVRDGDWPEFRGLQRDGIVRDAVFSTDWTTQPPRELWRRQVGPGWSSFTVVDQYLFTQEQRGSSEVVVCYRSETGEQCWVNAVETRFNESVSGAGPRATPTFHEGQLFTTGATGTVQCLDASTGRTIWWRDLIQDTQAKQPMWGFSSSPLIVGDVAIVFAGGPDGKSVIAYDCGSGEIVWTNGEGLLSYSSPHLAQAGDQAVVLMLTELGMEVYEPATGEVLWKYDWKVQGMRIIQPQVLSDQRLIIGEDYSGCRMVRFDRTPSGWTSEELWASRDLKPYFNDSVYLNGFCYGFSGNIFTCIDANTGRRRWKRGRYGFGQVLLAEKMNALLVLSETGEVVLLEANPAAHVEFSTFPGHRRQNLEPPCDGAWEAVRAKRSGGGLFRAACDRIDGSGSVEGRSRCKPLLDDGSAFQGQVAADRADHLIRSGAFSIRRT